MSKIIENLKCFFLKPTDLIKILNYILMSLLYEDKNPIFSTTIHPYKYYKYFYT